MEVRMLAKHAYYVCCKHTHTYAPHCTHTAQAVYQPVRGGAVGQQALAPISVEQAPAVLAVLASECLSHHPG
eukprot:scaffold300469_cov21-Tisochrysis_lutea.AAC.1